MSRPLKVLVVDDDLVATLAITAWLEQAGFEVASRTSAFGTGPMLLKLQPDVVLLDVEMPGISGAGLAELITRRMARKAIGVIFYSGKRAEILSELSEKYRALGFIEKTETGGAFLEQFYALTADIRARLE